jgi:hypothetical protein
VGGDDWLGRVRHPRALDEQTDAFECRVVPGAEAKVRVQPGHVDIWIDVVRDHLDVVASKRERRRATGAEETDDEHALGEPVHRDKPRLTHAARS